MTGAHIVLNGEERPLAAATLTGMLREAGIAAGKRGIAVAINETVVPRREWPATTLQPGDRVEVVKLFAGG
jgi:sulfur carrier protein